MQITLHKLCIKAGRRGRCSHHQGLRDGADYHCTGHLTQDKHPLTRQDLQVAFIKHKHQETRLEGIATNTRKHAFFSIQKVSEDEIVAVMDRFQGLDLSTELGPQ